MNELNSKDRIWPMVALALVGLAVAIFYSIKGCIFLLKLLGVKSTIAVSIWMVVTIPISVVLLLYIMYVVFWVFCKIIDLLGATDLR